MSKVVFVSVAASLVAACGLAVGQSPAKAPGVEKTSAGIRPDATMLQFPDVWGDRIVFCYANDLWTAPKAGGTATRLASPPGAESFPKFSPDGQTIAFVGSYDGGKDIYTIPANGAGVATRVTHHPGAETLCDWSPDGKSLVFYTTGFGGLGRQQQILTVPATGGMPTQLPVPYGTFASISGDGTWLAYTPHTTDFRTWKRYRGGMATDLWLFNLNDKSSIKATTWEGTDTSPMWTTDASGVLYYLSDQGENHLMNVWSFDPKTGKREQVSKFNEFDAKFPSIGPGADGKSPEIVCQNGSKLYLVNAKTGSAKEIDVVIPGDRPGLRAKGVDYANYIAGADVSKTGKRVVVSARGDLWSLPAQQGAARPLSQTDGVAERDPVYSPDGKTIAFLSDASGEYEVYTMPADGSAEATRLTTSGEKGVPAAMWRYLGIYSPDSTMLTWFDKSGSLFLTTIATGETVLVAKDMGGENPPHSFSSDSQWIALTLSQENQHHAVHLYSIPEKKLTRVTDPIFNAGMATFDRKGDYLYFVADRKFQATYASIDGSFIYKDSGTILCVPLRADMDSPFAPKNDVEASDKKKDDDKKEEGKKDEAKKEDAKGDEKLAEKSDASKDAEKKDDSKSDEKKSDDKKPDEKKPEDKQKDDAKKPKPVKIDIDGFERRAIELPVPPGSYGGLAVSDSGKLFFVTREDPDPDSDERPQGVIKMFDVADEGKDGKRTAKTVLAGVGGFSMSGDGKKLLVMKGRDMAVIDAAPDQKMDKRVPTGTMKGQIDPRVEWEQIITDVGRLHRDFFYVANMHGVDWPAQVDRYKAMLADCVTRDDVNYLIRELISELNVGHAYLTGPGDVDNTPGASISTLGCDFELVKSGDGTAYRIARIWEGAPWDSDARGPLSQPGVKVKAGDYLLEVNGVAVDTAKDPWAAFVGIAPGSTITITVADVPHTKGAKAEKEGDADHSPREVVVKAIGLGEEMRLRYRAWIERNRAYVAEKSGGKVAYVYVPNTGVDGQTDLFRQFYGQRDRAAMIIDERWNGGGQIPNRFIELLNRPTLNYWAVRDGKDWEWPTDSHQGPKCMLVNGLAGSGGDCFPWYFQKTGLGKVIGTRTWGGLVGISGNPGLIDGGGIAVPTFGFYEKDGTWGVEGHGIDPDMVVEDDPALMQNGGDPQLDAAITHMLKEIESKPHVRPKRPEAPNRKGMGIPPADR